MSDRLPDRLAGLVHGGVDSLAMWLEDRLPLEPEPFVPVVARPLTCLAPLASVPEPPAAPGPWSAPSPAPVRDGDCMALHVLAARAPCRGVVVLVPPWKIVGPSLVERYTGLLTALGHEVWLLVPPAHMHRAEPGVASGAGFVQLDLARFRAVFEQLVLEIRTAVAMALDRGPVGVVALSLGALAASLAISAEREVEFAALVAPPVDLAAVLSTTAIGRRYRRLAERAGTRFPDDRELRDALWPYDPRLRPRPASRLLLAAGRHDAIALPGGALELARAWRVEPFVYPRGHVTLLFACRALLRDLRRFASAEGGR